MKPILIKHIDGENIGRFPVWMMRQAGRYLPRYREIRKNYSFWESVENPNVAAEISLLPLEVLPVDAVIFFSDILTLPYGLGVPVTLQENVGPVISEPLKNRKAFDIFESFSAVKHVPYVGEALGKIKQQIAPEMALLGFAGAPWTVASYLIEGKANKNYPTIKGWMFSDPASLADALRSLAGATIKYLKYQVESGAHMVQLFDTWVEEMPLSFFEKFYLPILKEIFEALGAQKTRCIYFSKNSSHLFAAIKSLPVAGLSVDSRLPLTEVEQRVGTGFFLQGNLDPTILLSCDTAMVRLKTRELVATARQLKKPAILNLGHGILQGTPVENAKAFVEEARTLWI